MLKLLKDLALALVNATLLLVAACLFLAWQLSLRVDGVAASFAENLQLVAPLRGDVQAMTSEIAGLRGDLAALATRTGEIDSAMLAALETRIDGVQVRLTAAGDRFDQLVQAPEQMIDHVIETGATQFSRAVNDIRSCEKPPS
jgi:hypothetical protein